MARRGGGFFGGRRERATFEDAPAAPTEGSLRGVEDALAGIAKQLGQLGKAGKALQGPDKDAPLGLPGLGPGKVKAAGQAFGFFGKTAKDAFGLIHPAASAVKEAVGGIASAAKSVFDSFGELTARLSSTAAQFGTTTQALQGFEGGFAPAGVGADALRGSLGGLQSKMYGLVTESAEAVKAFYRLGLTVTKAGGGFKPVTQVFDEALEKLVQIKDPTIRAGRALDTVGEAGLRAANYWRNNGGIEGLRAYRKEIEGFGVVLQQDVDAAGRFRLESGKLNLVLQDFRNDVGGPLHELLGDIAKDMFVWIKAQGKAGSTSKPLRDSVERLANLRGPVTELTKKAFTFGQNALPLVVDGMRAFGTVVVGVTEGIRSGLVFALEKMGGVAIGVGLALAFAFAPVTTTIAGLLLVAEDFINYQKGVPSVIGDTVESFKKFRNEFGKGLDEPPALKILRAMAVFAEKAYNFVDKLTNKLASGVFVPLFRGLDRAAAEIDAFALGGKTDRSKKIRENAAVFDEATKRQGFFDSIGTNLGLSGSKARFEALQEQVRAERAGVNQSLPPSALPGPQSVAPPPAISPQSPAAVRADLVPVSPYTTGGAQVVKQANVKVDLHIAGNVIDGKDFVKRNKDAIQEVFEESTAELFSSAGPN